MKKRQRCKRGITKAQIFRYLAEKYLNHTIMLRNYWHGGAWFGPQGCIIFIPGVTPNGGFAAEFLARNVPDRGINP